MLVKAKYVGNGRFYLVDEETGNVVDDARGFGYKSAQKAYAAWSYKMKSKKEKAILKEEKRRAHAWWEKHGKFHGEVENEIVHSMKDGVPFGVKELKELMEIWKISSEIDTKVLLKYFG